MTHTLHRQGTAENLANDYLVMALPGVPSPDIRERMDKFYQICMKYEPVNYRSSISWRIYVFDEKEKVDKILQEIVEADLGISIVVSGLYDKVRDCCHKAGIDEPHTINYSLGFWGNTGKLPEGNILELTTMCGHSLISPNLVKDMARRIAKGFPAASAAEKIARSCVCDIFNTKRGEVLLEKIAGDIRSGKLNIS